MLKALKCWSLVAIAPPAPTFEKKIEDWAWPNKSACEAGGLTMESVANPLHQPRTLKGSISFTTVSHKTGQSPSVTIQLGKKDVLVTTLNYDCT